MAKPDGNSELSDPENSCSLSASRNIKSLDDLEKSLKNISSFVIENSGSKFCFQTYKRQEL